MPRLRWAADARGGAASEFALVAPATLVLLMGLADLAYEAYIQSVLTGAVQKAGRDNTLQASASQTDAMDAAVENAVKAVVPGAQFNSRALRRANFDNYASMAGEPFVDTIYPNPGGTFDGTCNHGENYIDLNNNQKWDSNISQTGEGGASDVARYTVTVTYNRLFPLARLIGWGSAVTLSATTILKNQPYLTQSVLTGTAKLTCS